MAAARHVVCWQAVSSMYRGHARQGVFSGRLNNRSVADTAASARLLPQEDAGRPFWDVCNEHTFRFMSAVCSYHNTLRIAGSG